MDERGRLRDRYAGTLPGLGCGGALGGPVEFRSREEIARDHPGGLRAFVGGWLDLAPGEITDDTQMTLALAEALTERGLDMGRPTETFLTRFRSGPKDVGNATARSLRAVAAGAPWPEAEAG